MKRSNTIIFTFLLILALFLFPQNSFAQLSGTYSIPGTPFATIKAAADSLNIVGVGAGGVTFNVAGGHTETVTAPITITATGTAGNPITFQRSSGSANPLVTRTDAGTLTTSTLGGAGDAVIRIEGSDYITFNLINVAATDQGIEYGYLTHKPDGINGCQFVTISNCAVSLTKGTSAYVAGIYIGNGTVSTSSAVGVTVSAASGMNSNVTVTGCFIQNVHAGILVRGSTAYYDSAITIGQSGAGNIIQNFGGGSATTTYGVYFIYVESPSVAYNIIDNAAGGGTAHNSTFYCVFYSTVTGDVVGSNNAMTISNTGASSVSYYLYNANTCTSEIYNNNTFAATGAFGTGTTYFVYSSNATPNKTISGNSTVGPIIKGGGGTYCYYNTGGASTGGSEIITNNTFSNITISSGSSTFYGIYSNTYAAHTKIFSNNTVSNITSLSTGSFYALYALASSPNQVDNNTAFNITHAGSIYGLYLSGTGSAYNNNIYGLTTTSTGTSFVDGIYVTSGTLDIYNNFVSDLNAPSSASTTAGACGIYLSGGTTVNLYYNTVFLKYTSVVAGNISTGLYVGSTAPTTVDMRDNIFVNNVDVTTGTRAVAFTKGGTSLTNLAATINNNLYYAGTPSPKNLIFYDGTNSDQTLTAYKGRITPRESASVTENPSFVNSTTPPYDLHINPAIPTQTESAGTPIATVTVDYDGNLRNATTPDIGADEFAGTPLDLVSPTIVYTPLLNTASTSSRTLVSSITDAGSGVPTAGLGLPVLYWKINLAGVWTGATSTYLTGSDYQFTFGSGVITGDTIYYYIAAQDLATTPNIGTFPSGGAGGFTPDPPAASTPPTTPSSYIVSNVALGGDYTVGTAMFNKISGKNIYFEKLVHKIMKEVDVLVSAPENRIEKGKETKSISTGLTDQSTKMKQWIEVEETTWIPMENGMPYTGDLYIKKVDHPEINFPDGIDGIYSTITAAVTDLNLRGVTAPVRFLLTDTLYSTGETYPITISIANENLPTATNTVTFKPNTGVTSVITGGTAQWVFGLNGCDYVTFDGSNTVGGTTRNLTIANTYTGGSFNLVIALFHNGVKGATNNTVKNCIIKGMPTTTSSYGLFLNAGGGGFHNTSLINNKIQNSKIGIQFAGVLGNKTNDGLISGNILGDVIEPLKIGGVLSAYADNLIITGNEILGEAAGNTNTSQYGILLSTGSTNSKVQKNNIHDFYYSGTSGYGCFGIRYASDATTVTEISNNFIRDIKGDGDATSLDYTPSGIYISTGGNVNSYFNSIYMSGNTLGRGTTYNGRSSCLSVAAGITLLDIRDNIFQNSMGSYPGSTRTNTTYGVYSNSANTAFTNINFNDYFVNGVSPSVGYLGANQIDLTAWQTATGSDLNSISAIAAFNDSTNLHIPNGTITALESAGTPIIGITTDIDGQTRNASTPDIGADEFAGINSTAALAGTYYIGVAGSGPGGTDPEFATLKAACDTLNISNVSGNTTFFITSNLVEPANVTIGIDPGSYTVTFKPYTGTVDTITFTQVADNAGVSGGWVFGTPSLIITSTTNYGLVTTENIIIDGSNTVDGTTRDLVVRTAAGISGNTNPIRIIGDVNNCVLKNLVVRTGQSVSYGISITNRFFAASGNWTPDNITVTNCDVSNTFGTTAQGIAISNSGTPTAFPTGIEFSYNDVVARTRGIFINYGGDANIFNNNITVNQTTTGYFSDGILTLSIGDTTNVINIYNNKFTLLSTANSSSGTYGIAAIEPGSRGIYNIYNNMITGFAATTSTANPNCIINGIRVTSALPKVNLYFNTIYMNDLAITPGTGTVLYTGIFVSNGIVVANNNIVQSDEVNFPSYAIYRSGTSGTLVSDYNDFYYSDTTNGFTGYWNTAATKTLVDWQTASGLDVNSLDVIAPFISASDLHIPDGSMTLLESAGTPIAMVTTDFDGQLRNPSTPDIGADEFAGIPPVFAPTNLTAVADTFAILLNWTDNSSNELGFYIERKNGDSLSVDPFVVIDTVGTDVASYNDLGRTPNTTYTYRVQAFNLLGVSPYSNEVTATTIIPVELTTFAATANEKEISIVWSTATELNNMGFDLERKLDAEWQKVAFVEGKGTTTEKSDYSYTDKFAYESFQGTVQYRLKQMDFNGTISYSTVISVEVDFTPKEYALYQNYPNPFNPSTTIKFALPFDSNVRIAIYNLLGEQVDVIFEQVKEVGYHNVSWNASSLASGVYFYTIEAKSIDGLKNFSSVKKMMLVK
jgi:hypothetical protein